MTQYPPPVPMHVQSLGYSLPMRGGRPGTITAIGIISIIVASLSVIASLVTGGYGVLMYKAMQVTTAIARASAARTAAAGPAASPPAIPAPAGPAAAGMHEEVDPRGMERADRDAVATALKTLEPLSAAQSGELHGLLARAGKGVFPTFYTGPAGADGEAGSASRPTPGLTPVTARAAVTGHNTMPSADPTDPDPIAFDTAGGHVVLYHDRAVFRPADGSPIVRVEGGPALVEADDADAGPAASPSAIPSTLPAPAATPGGYRPPSALTPAQVQTVVAKAQAAAGNRMNPAQVAGLTTLLQSPTQQFVTPATVWSPVNIAQVQPDGSVMLKLTNGYLVLDPQGQVQQQFTTGGPPALVIHPLCIALVIGEAVLSIALAVYLLVIGILVIRQSPRAGRLHLLYAVVKIPLAVAGGWGFAWLLTDLFASLSRMSSAAVAPNATSGAVTIAIMIGVAGLLYPIGLLFALRSQTARQYYHSITGPG